MKIFKLNDNEKENAKAFVNEHSECVKKMPVATDGVYAFTYSFTPGGIGVIAKIKCNCCGKELNITDYKNW